MKYGIRGIPTLMLFKDGAIVGTKVGALSKSQLMQFIDSAISTRRPGPARLKQRSAARRPVAPRGPPDAFEATPLRVRDAEKPARSL